MLRGIIRQYKAEVVFVSDIIIFGASLALTLFIRYGNASFVSAWHTHRMPFLVLLVLWLLVFYIAGLYNYATFRTTLDNGKLFGSALLVNFFLSIAIFYSFGNFFRLTPKLNLFIFSGIFAVLDSAWRYALARILSSKNNREILLMVSVSPVAGIAIEHVEKHPQLGTIIHRYGGADGTLEQAVTKYACTAIIVDNAMLKNESITRALYKLLSRHIGVQTLEDFYESLFRRVPLQEINEEWFIQEMKKKTNIYDSVRQLLDVCLSALALIILSPILIIVSILVGTTSSGPVIYRQKRVGKDGKEFTLYKFRNMYHAPEKNPDAKSGAPVWWSANDTRVTPVGKILRRTHLDELPQLFNILKGNMLFVGPRPERPEFVATLKEEIPHYMIRSTVKPGLTGWAQVKYHYGGTVAEAANKLEYDIYYLKNRSFLFDLLILLKTIQKIS